MFHHKNGEAQPFGSGGDVRTHVVSALLQLVFKIPRAFFQDQNVRIISRAGFRGGGGGEPRAPGLPPTGGLPPNPSIFKTL